MSRSSSTTTTLSVRLLWPFLRILTVNPDATGFLSTSGIAWKDVVNPDARVAHGVAMEALQRLVTEFGDPTIGLRAGERTEQGETGVFDVLEFAARSAPNFGEALDVLARYFRILHDAAELSVVVEGDVALCRHRMLDSIPQPPAANDFTIASSLSFSRRNVSVYEPPLEIWLAHEKTDYADLYDEAFGAKVRFAAPFNAILIDKARLLVPMQRANTGMSIAFQRQAQRLLDRLQDRDSFVGRVRAAVIAQFETGEVSMQKIARHLAVGVATLRRRLEEEGKTFRDIVDELRKELAMQHLGGNGPTVSEVAFLLGFSDVRAFGRAFRRWTGQSPTEYRARTTQ